LQPGDEKYFCYTMNMPADQDLVVTRLVPTYGAATHHLLFSQALAPEPDGFSECPVLSKDTWIPMYAGGRNSGPLEAPAGAGFVLLKKGQQLVMQLHLQNATQDVVSAVTAMRIEYAPNTPMIVPAGIFGLDNRKLTIPPHDTAALNSMSCSPNKALTVFATMGHMHKHGRHLQLSRGAALGADILFDVDWSFDLQPVTPVAMQIAPTDQLFLQCTHDNEGDTAIPYGESSDTEMCANVLYYTPYDGLDGCINL
jgi:hypothetical protein